MCCLPLDDLHFLSRFSFPRLTLRHRHQFHPAPEVVGQHDQLEKGMIAPELFGRNGRQPFLLFLYYVKSLF